MLGKRLIRRLRGICGIRFQANGFSRPRADTCVPMPEAFRVNLQLADRPGGLLIPWFRVRIPAGSHAQKVVARAFHRALARCSRGRATDGRFCRRSVARSTHVSIT